MNFPALQQQKPSSATSHATSAYNNSKARSSSNNSSNNNTQNPLRSQSSGNMHQQLQQSASGHQGYPQDYNVARNVSMMHAGANVIHTQQPSHAHASGSGANHAGTNSARSSSSSHW